MNNVAINLAILALGILIAPMVEHYLGSTFYVMAGLLVVAGSMKLFLVARAPRRGPASHPI